MTGGPRGRPAPLGGATRPDPARWGCCRAHPSAGAASGGGDGPSQRQGPAIKSAEINSGSQPGIGWTFAVLVLVALAALGFPFFVNALNTTTAE